MLKGTEKGEREGAPVSAVEQRDLEIESAREKKKTKEELMMMMMMMMIKKKKKKKDKTNDTIIHNNDTIESISHDK